MWSKSAKNDEQFRQITETMFCRLIATSHCTAAIKKKKRSERRSHTGSKKNQVAPQGQIAHMVLDVSRTQSVAIVPSVCSGPGVVGGMVGGMRAQAAVMWIQRSLRSRMGKCLCSPKCAFWSVLLKVQSNQLFMPSSRRLRCDIPKRPVKTKWKSQRFNLSLIVEVRALCPWPGTPQPPSSPF